MATKPGPCWRSTAASLLKLDCRNRLLRFNLQQALLFLVQIINLLHIKVIGHEHTQ